MKQTVIAGLGAAALFASGCSTVETGSHRAQQAAAGVGERVQYHATKVERKTRSFWHWLFGGSDERTTSRKSRPKPASSSTRLPNYPQQYVGQQD